MSGHHRWADTRDARRFRTVTGVDRRLGMYCSCPLLDCCHNERDGESFGCGRRGGHAESGNPATGYLWPWTDEEYNAQQRYWNRPDPDDYPEGSLERLATEALLDEWRKNELAARQRGNDGGRAYTEGENAAP